MSCEFEEWLGSITSSGEIFNTFEEALSDLVKNGKDFSQYISSYNLILNNVAFVQKDEDGKYFTEITIPQHDDIITNFTHTPSKGVKIDLMIDGIKSPIFYHTKLVRVAAMYTEIKIRFTFEDELTFQCLKDTEKSVKLECLAYVLQTKLNEYLRGKKIDQNGITYANGMATVNYIQ